MALNGLTCAEMPLRIYSLTHSTHPLTWSPYRPGRGADTGHRNRWCHEDSHPAKVATVLLQHGQ